MPWILPLDYDVIIIGAGPAGMIAMARFAAAGFRVCGIERAADKALPSQDLRSTAFLMPSIDVLKNAGLWDDLQPHSTALDVMEIVDGAQLPPKRVEFRASELRQDHFGWNVMNVQLNAKLRDHISKNTRIDLFFEREVEDFYQFHDRIEMQLNDGERINGRLLVAADGRNSSIRERLGIACNIHRFEQSALVFTVSHEQMHQNVSTEIHLTGGPFTFVPREDVNDAHASAIVWMDKLVINQTRMSLPEGEFNAEINRRSLNLRGNLTKISPLAAFPMITLEAQKLVKHRAVIIGEAAHVVPPIGAQGLNMSLRDVESLVRVAERGGIENPNYLLSWERNRRVDIAIRNRGIRLLDEISIGEAPLSEKIRRFGLPQLEKSTTLRQGLMRLGLGSR